MQFLCKQTFQSSTRYHATRPSTSVAELPIGFNADPDPAFYLNADPDTESDPGRQTNAKSRKKLDFDMKNLLYVGNMS
jgi:hypothetical protein